MAVEACEGLATLIEILNQEISAQTCARLGERGNGQNPSNGAPPRRAVPRLPTTTALAALSVVYGDIG
ncbi:MAG: hypothetical protein ACREE4_14540, partial [Stellaceae bacterium]